MSGFSLVLIGAGVSLLTLLGVYLYSGYREWKDKVDLFSSRMDEINDSLYLLEDRIRTLTTRVDDHTDSFRTLRADLRSMQLGVSMGPIRLRNTFNLEEIVQPANPDIVIGHTTEPAEQEARTRYARLLDD